MMMTLEQDSDAPSYCRRGLSLLGIALVAVGCSSAAPEHKPLDKTHENLMHVGTAYQQFCSENKRAPAGPADLEPKLKEFGDPKEILASPRDGQPFVVCWNVDLSKPVPWAKTFPVLAYEKIGAGGKRWVLTTLRSVEETDAAAFAKAEFPPGQAPSR
jgi:hypothetical protein